MPICCTDGQGRPVSRVTSNFEIGAGHGASHPYKAITSNLSKRIQKFKRFGKLGFNQIGDRLDDLESWIHLPSEQ